MMHKDKYEKVLKRKCRNCNRIFNVRYKNQYYCDEDLSKMGKRNKRKGASNELRFFKKLQKELDKYELPYKVRRTPRSGAIHEFEPSDALWSNLPNDSVFRAHWELKDTLNWSIEKWFKKACEYSETVQRKYMLILTHIIPIMNRPGAIFFMSQEETQILKNSLEDLKIMEKEIDQQASDFVRQYWVNRLSVQLRSEEHTSELQSH